MCVRVFVCVSVKGGHSSAPMRLVLIKLEVARTASGRKNFLNFVVISFTQLEFLSANL